jgi:hypothetical protein
MRKLIVISALALIVSAPFACKKKETTSSPIASTTTAGGTTTGNSTTTSQNTLSILSGTTTTVYNLTDRDSTLDLSPPPIIQFDASDASIDNFISTVINTTVNISGVFSITTTPPNASSGNVLIRTNLFTTEYLATSGSFTASIINNKQRIQMNNITCAATLSTSVPQSIKISADYIMP